MADKTKIGLVTQRDAQGYYLVECPIGIGAIDYTWLRPMDMKGATVGDRVELIYQVTPSSGLWRVREVFKR